MRYLIIGGTGSLGKKFIERLLPSNDVFVMSRDESKHWSLRNEFADHPSCKKLSCIVGDIRDKTRILSTLRRTKPDFVIVAAALKQVDTCELSPSESVLTNLVGTQNVVDAVKEYIAPGNEKLEAVLFVSTDKACAPINVYGMCKGLSERIVTSADPHADAAVRFLCTRYGNVLESRGSIIPLFRYQAENNEHLTVTDPEMTRYLMTLDESVDLIETALDHGKNGETWIPRLPAMKIGDLAELFSEHFKKPIKVIGLRPGEKQHEDLVNESESVRTTPNEEGTHYVIGPAYMQVSAGSKRFAYSSNHDVLTKRQLKAKLEKLGMFDRSIASFPGLSIEEIITKRK